MRAIVSSCLIIFVVGNGTGLEDPPISDERLSIHTLVREDIFAGWRSDDMDRFARGERNIDLLLKKRPKAKAELLAWKGAARLFRAVLAHEAKKDNDFQRLYKESLGFFAEARKIAPYNGGVASLIGGGYVQFADRLPKKYRKAAWSDSYASYQVLWTQQAQFVEKMPVHMRGELLGGLAQSAQRTGRDEELEKYLGMILKTLPGTAYERVAKRWKKDPSAAATGNISCKTCHTAGRLSARIEQLKDK